MPRRGINPAAPEGGLRRSTFAGRARAIALLLAGSAFLITGVISTPVAEAAPPADTIAIYVSYAHTSHSAVHVAVEGWNRKGNRIHFHSVRQCPSGAAYCVDAYTGGGNDARTFGISGSGKIGPSYRLKITTPGASLRVMASMLCHEIGHAVLNRDDSIDKGSQRTTCQSAKLVENMPFTTKPGTTDFQMLDRAYAHIKGLGPAAHKPAAPKPAAPKPAAPKPAAAPPAPVEAVAPVDASAPLDPNAPAQVGGGEAPPAPAAAVPAAPVASLPPPAAAPPPVAAVPVAHAPATAHAVPAPAHAVVKPAAPVAAPVAAPAAAPATTASTTDPAAAISVNAPAASAAPDVQGASTVAGTSLATTPQTGAGGDINLNPGGIMLALGGGLLLGMGIRRRQDGSAPIVAWRTPWDPTLMLAPVATISSHHRYAMPGTR